MAEFNGVVLPGDLSPEISAIYAGPGDHRPRAGSAEFSIRLDQPLDEATSRLERAMLAHALHITGGQIDAAARLLGLSRKGLYLKRQRLGIRLSDLGSRIS
jgi:DNA-binding NtrC family response regulator